MGHVINPLAFRLKTIRYWDSLYSLTQNKNYSYLLNLDIALLHFIESIISGWEVSNLDLFFSNVKLLRSYNKTIFSIILFRYSGEILLKSKNNLISKHSFINLSKKLDNSNYSLFYNNVIRIKQFGLLPNYRAHINKDFTKNSKRHDEFQKNYKIVSNYFLRNLFEYSKSKKNDSRSWHKMLVFRSQILINKLKFYDFIKLYGVADLNQGFSNNTNSNKNETLFPYLGFYKVLTYLPYYTLIGFIKALLIKFLYKKFNLLKIKKIELNILIRAPFNLSVNVIRDFILLKIAQRYRLKAVTSIILKFLNFFKNRKLIRGYKLFLAGRFSRRDRSTYYWKASGLLPLNSKTAKIDFSWGYRALRFSLCIAKVWINF